MSEWANNNGAKLPSWDCINNGFFWTSSGPLQNPPCNNSLEVKLSYYPTTTTGNIFLNTASGHVNAYTNTEGVSFYEKAKCNSDGSAEMASSRQAVALYALESGGGAISQCQEI